MTDNQLIQAYNLACDYLNSLEVGTSEYYSAMKQCDTLLAELIKRGIDPDDK